MCTTSSAKVSDNQSKEYIVTALAVGLGSGGNHNGIVGGLTLKKREQTVADKLSHLGMGERIKVKDLLYGEDIFAWPLHDLKNAEVPV